MTRAKSGQESSEDGPPFPVAPEAIKVLETLWDAGHAAYLVGGDVRDGLLTLEPTDGPWDMASDAQPEELLELFPGSSYGNRFGTVTVSGTPGMPDAEITTFRREQHYGDHRRPDTVTFTDSIDEDLARRDFTVNAIAWGRAASDPTARLIDPWGGRADLDAGLLRAVGDPDARFGEDALRIVRAARIAGQVGLTIEPDTLAAMTRHADDVRYLAAERIGAELRKLLRSTPPSAGFGHLSRSGVVAPLFPELAAQRGVPQGKLPGQDLWDHCMATLDAAAALAPGSEDLALAALLHDTGKPETFVDGHFRGHDEAGARIATSFLARMGFSAGTARRVSELVRHHMFSYERSWTDTAIRRFMRRVGVESVDDLLMLRAADNVGSGLPPEAGHLDEMRARIEEQRRAGVALSLADLAIDGNDVMEELDEKAGPWLGRLLDRLLDSVVADPARNRRELLLNDARLWAERSRESAVRP